MPISKKEVTTNLNLSLISPKFKSVKNKSEVKEKVGKFVVDKINSYLDGSKSPVSKGIYKAFRADKKPSMLFEEGDLRSAITYKEVPGGVKIGVFNEKEAPKGYNHNVGDTLPVRRFIPISGEIFKKDIINGIKKIIDKESNV